MNPQGDYAIVGACYDDDKGDNAGACYAFARVGHTWVQKFKFYGSNTKAGDIFGLSVAMTLDGDRVFVGAPGADTDGRTVSGAIYVFEREGEVWHQHGIPYAVDAAISNNGRIFGRSVACSDNGAHILVGCSASDQFTGGIASGVVFYLTYDGTFFTEKQRFWSSTATQSDYFGHGLCMDTAGSVAIIGAPYDDNVYSDDGSIFVFTRTGDVWAQQQKLPTPVMDAAPGYGLGSAISGDGTTIVIGRTNAVGNLSGVGAFYLYKRVGSTYTLKKIVYANDAQKNDQFSFSIALNYDGTVALVGACGDDDRGISAGAVYMLATGDVVGESYCFRSTTYLPEAVRNTGDFFGGGLALSGDGTYALVGCSYENLINKGYVYAFERSGMNWVYKTKFSSSDISETANEAFALQVSMSSDAQHAVISAQNKAVSGLEQVGAVYYFTRSGDNWIEQQKIVCPDVEAYANFGAGLAISGDGLCMLVGAENKAVGSILTAGKVYYYTRSGNTWTLVNSFASPDNPVNAWRFGGGIALNYTGDYAMVGGVFTQLTGLASGAVNVFNRNGNVWTVTGLIPSPERNSESTAFGIGIAITRDLKFALIGAPTADGMYRDSGAVYLYERNPITYKWNFVRKITGNVKGGNTFGRAVAMSESANHFLVSELRNDDVGLDTGAFHYFSMGREGDAALANDDEYRKRSVVIPIDTSAHDLFGYKTAIDPSGNWMIATAPDKDLSGVENRGKVYSYRRLNNQWTTYGFQELIPSDYSVMGTSPRFGSSVAIEKSSGAYVAIGASADNRFGSAYGGVYLYTSAFTDKDIVNYNYHSVIQSNASQSGEAFGESVSLSNNADYVAVGCPFYTGTQTNQGRVQIFTRSGTSYTHQATLIAPTPQANHRFGNPVAINGAGDLLAVSAYHDSNAMNNGASVAGAVFIYKRVGVTWSLAEKILPPEVTMGFGVGMTYVENKKQLLVSALKPGETDAVVYQYDMSGVNALYLKEVMSIKTGIDSIDGQYSPSLSADPWGRWVAAGCFYKDAVGINSGEVQMFSTMDFNLQTEPYFLMNNEKKMLQLSKIYPPTANQGLNFGVSVKVSGDEQYMFVSEIGATVGGVASAGRVQIYTKDTAGKWRFKATLNNPSPGPTDWFGVGIAVNYDATYLLVSSYRSDVTAADAGIIHTFTRTGDTWTQGASITIPEAIANSDFGTSISLSSDSLQLAVGAQGGSVSGVASGVVYCFKRADTASAWAFDQKLYPSDYSQGDGYGRSVSIATTIDAFYLAVSAYQDTTTVTNQGSVYIYRKDQDNWILQAKITAPDPTLQDYFGISSSLSSDGQTLAVGASANDNMGVNSGCVYIFTRRGNDWRFRYKVYPNDVIAGQSFGISTNFSFYGSKLYVGSHTDNEFGTNSGAVYEFLNNMSPMDIQYPSNRLIPAFRFSDPILAAGDEFTGGSAISEDGTMLIVGYRKDVSTGDRGYAWFYRRDAGKNNFTNKTIITAPDGVADDLFGGSITADSTFTHFIIGAHQAQVGGVASGKVYYFTRSGDTFTFVQSFSSPDSAGYQAYGVSVCMNDAGDYLLVGNYHGTAALTGGNSRGAVHVYTRSGSTWTLQQTLLAHDKADGDNFGASVSVNSDATRILISSRFDDDAGTDTGSIYYYTRSGSTFTFVSKIYDPIPQTDSRWGGGALALNGDGSYAFIGNYRRTVNGTIHGVVYTYRLVGSTWKRESELAIPINIYKYAAFSVTSASRNLQFLMATDTAGISGRYGGHTFYANARLYPEFFYR
jgi:phage pi2 protein 07